MSHYHKVNLLAELPDCSFQTFREERRLSGPQVK